MNRNHWTQGFASMGVATVVAAIAAIFATSALAQGDANWQKVVAAAKKEGNLVIYYQTVAPLMDRVVKEFNAVYPEIKVESKRQVQPAQHMAVIENEKKANIDGADITQYANAIWYKEKAAENYFLKPVGPANADYPKEKLLYGAVPVIAVQPFFIAYNTNQVKTPITGYKDLLRPEFKGKLAASDLVAETVYAYWEWLEKTQGADYLEKFAAQQPKLLVGTVPITQGAASGEFAATAMSIFAIANPLIAQGAPLKVVLPNPMFASEDVMAALSHAKRPNAALVFLDFIMSKRGQTAWNGRGETGSVVAGIPGSLDSKNMQPWDPFRYTPEFQKVYQAKFNKIFKP